MLQATQTAYKGRHVVKQYILDDLSVSTIEISPNELTDADLGIFISNSFKDEALFQKLEGLAQAMIQNDKAKFSDMIKMLNTNSPQELESHIIESETKAEQMMQQQFQQQTEAALQQQREAQQFELEKINLTNEGKIRVAEIQSFARLQDQDSDNDGTPDQLEIDKFKVEAALKSRKLDLEELKTKESIRQKDEDLKIKKRQKTK